MDGDGEWTPDHSYYSMASELVAQYAVEMAQCVCGVALNAGMLVIFFTMKQVRGSVYTAYMIQIAITDLLVCLTWMVVCALSIASILNFKSVIADLDSKSELAGGGLQELTIDATTAAPQAVVYAIYNFHYYVNIFLLATMSVERCVAVWKSLRCQRYQFNKKFTYAVSVLMWLLALACAVPGFYNTSLVSGAAPATPQNFTLDAENQLAQADDDLSVLYKCYIPYRESQRLNTTYVEDFGGTSVEECYHHLESIIQARYINKLARDGVNLTDLDLYLDYANEASSDDYDSYMGELLGNPATDELYDRPNDTTANRTMLVANKQAYSELLEGARLLITDDARRIDLVDVCDPQLSDQAKVYHVVVNLVIGFFVPFAAIVVSYLAIAYMIAKRAQHRIQDECVEAGLTVSGGGGGELGRRMSGFLRQFVGSNGAGATKSGGDDDSPLLQRRVTGRLSRVATQTSTQQRNAPTATQPLIENQRVDQFRGAADARIRFSPPLVLSTAAAQLRRISGGSASSAESFLTDQTSLQTSPGIRLSAPLFHHHDKMMIQRASSADNGAAAANNNNNSHQQLIEHLQRRHSSDLLFRSCQAIEPEDNSQVKKQAADHYRRNTNDCNGGGAMSERSPLASPRGGGREQSEGGSMPELSGDDGGRGQQPEASKPGARPRPAAPPSAQQRASNYAMSVGRKRLYSEASGGEGTLRKTMAHRNAERHMKISRTVITYVLVFSVCWLPQRIATLTYDLEAMIGLRGHTCHTVMTVTRIISFFSVLLNPIVYAVTQRDIRNHLRHTWRRARKRLRCATPRRHSPVPSGAEKQPAPRQRAPTAAPENATRGPATNNVSTDPVAQHPEVAAPDDKLDRHLRNRERRLWLVQRLGRPNARSSITRSAVDEKPSDGTIDEDKDAEEKALSSSHKLTSGSESSGGKRRVDWDDWQQLIDMASGRPAPAITETVL